MLKVQIARLISAGLIEYWINDLTHANVSQLGEITNFNM